MTTNQEILQEIVNDLGCKPSVPSIPELLVMLIQEQRQTNNVLQNLAEAIASLAATFEPDIATEERHISEAEKYHGL